MEPSGDRSVLQLLPAFIAEWCLKVSPSSDEDPHSCVICTRTIGNEDVPADLSLLRTKEERDSFKETATTCIFPQAVNSEEGEERSGAATTEERLVCCSTCFSHMKAMVDLFQQLETLRLQFNELREEVGTSWVKSCCRYNQNKEGHAKHSVKEEQDYEDIQKWKEGMQKREHIFPSLLKSHWMSSLSTLEREHPVEANEFDVNTSFASVGIKQEIEDDESSSYSYDGGAEDFIVKPDIDVYSAATKLDADALNDTKITKLTPVVKLCRLPPQTNINIEQKVKVEHAENKPTHSSGDRKQRRTSRAKERVYYSEVNEDGERYIPPFDWNLDELPSRKKRAAALAATSRSFADPVVNEDDDSEEMITYSQNAASNSAPRRRKVARKVLISSDVPKNVQHDPPASFVDSYNFDLESKKSSAGTLAAAKIDYNLDELPSRRRRAAAVASASKNCTYPSDSNAGKIEVEDAIDDYSVASDNDYEPTSDADPSSSENENSEMAEIRRSLLKETVRSIGVKKIQTIAPYRGGTNSKRGRPKIVPGSVDLFATTEPQDELADLGKFDCKVCHLSFPSRQEIREHITAKHKKDMPFKCSSCPKRFINSNSLRSHSLVHVSFSRTHKCDHCDGQFSDGRALIGHRVKAHCLFDPTESHGCTKCLRYFDGPSYLRRHTESTHGGKNGTKNIRCGLCEFKPRFDSVESLNAHAESEDHKKAILSRRNIHCSLCTIKFTSLDELKSHLESPEHTHEKQKLVEIDLYTYCKICRVQCESREALSRHRKTEEHRDNQSKLHENKETHKGPFPCPECGKVLSSKANAISHMKIMHSQKSYQCEVCGKSFSRGRDFRFHLRSHGGVKPIQCEVCGKGFTSRPAFLQHMKAHKTAPQTYMCDSCGKIYASSTSLNNHVLLVHPAPGQESQYAYRCKYCPGTFNSPNKCRRHMTEEHADVYLQGETHLCNVCWHKFATNDLLQEHMAIHDGLKCGVCGKMCKMKGHLVKHMRSHTGERPFPCTICGKAFTDASNLKEHTYRHTGERPHKCEFCNEGFLRRGEMMKHREEAHDVQDD